ncbi:MAG: sulfotransferase, partial [Phycisphaerae bacterium]
MNRIWPEFVYPIVDTAWRSRLVLTGRGYPLHRGEPIRPCFVVGAPRSGNTLVRRILTTNDQLHIPPETYVLAQVIRAFRRHRAQPWHHLVLLVLALFEFNPEFDRFGVSLRPLFKELRDAPRDARSLALILDRLYRYHGESVNRSCERWGDKTPLNIYCLPELRSVFPGAQFIHVVRD